MLTGWRHERQIRAALKALARQRVAAILQPGNAWVLEYPASEAEPGVAEALRTCHLRGWVEVVHDGVPQMQWEGGNQPPRDAGVAPLYRLTEAGWAQIRRTHAWVIATFFVALASLVAALALLAF